MKLSRAVSLLSLASLALVAACDSGDHDKLNDRAITAAQPPTDTPPVARPPRTMIEGNALPTSPVNLLVDPGFSLVGQQAGFGSFLALDENTFAQVPITSAVDSRSPAGFGGGVATLKAAGATNKSSAPAILLTSFQGGAGPFHAEVWVSKSDVSGAPVDLTFDAKGVRASVANESPDGTAIDLVVVPGATRSAGGRTWTLLAADVEGPLTYGGFFILHTGTAGGAYLVAAPSVLAQPLVAGLTPTRSRSAAQRARAKTSVEQRAIAAYRAAPPRLLPAPAR